MSSGKFQHHQHHQQRVSPQTPPLPMQQQLSRMLQQPVSSGVQVPPPPPPQLLAAATDAIGLPSWAYAHPALMPLDPQTESLAENWRQFQQAAYNYNLDPHLLAMYGGGFSAAAGGRPDLMHGQRRKNATRETTGVLKAWLGEHKKNPYPTKGEKIMLAIITTMTLTQVSTWFANARRRLKKENKMTWVPRNRADDTADASATGGAAADAVDYEEVDDDIDGDDDSEGRVGDIDEDRRQQPRKRLSADGDGAADRDDCDEASLNGSKRARRQSTSGESSLELHRCQQPSPPSQSALPPPLPPPPQLKPRIWSIVDTATKAEPLKASAASAAAAAAASVNAGWPAVSPVAGKAGGGVFFPHLFYAAGPPAVVLPPQPPMLPFHQHQQHLHQHQLQHLHQHQLHQQQQAIRFAEFAAFSAFGRHPFPPPPLPMLSPQPSPPTSRKSP